MYVLSITSVDTNPFQCKGTDRKGTQDRGTPLVSGGRQNGQVVEGTATQQHAANKKFFRIIYIYIYIEKPPM